LILIFNMKKSFLLLAIVLFNSGLVFAQKENQLAFAPGEMLHYLVKYQWGPFNTEVGDVVFTIEQKSDTIKPYYIAKANGKSFKFYDVFFKVRDYYESRFYPEDIIPFYFYRDVLEGKYHMKNYIYFLKDNNIRALYKKRDKPIRDTLHKVSTKTYDLLSLIYSIRNENIASRPVGVASTVGFAIDGKINYVKYSFAGSEVKKVPGLGTFNTLKVEAKPVAGHAFKGNEVISVWITADENRVPLIIETSIQVGYISARLAEYSNLKYPLKSKVK